MPAKKAANPNDSGSVASASSADAADVKLIALTFRGDAASCVLLWSEQQSWREHELEFELTLTDGSKYPHAGRLLFANRQVDSLTGTLRIATAFPNPRRLLRPGQFGRVRAATRVEHNALLVPQRAVTELQGTFQVMVLKSDSTVTVQPVVLGPQVDSLRVIERGLKPDQLVIVEGTQQVRPGMKVAAKPYAPVRGPARASGY
jgi:membrane fusion protein (multidrug efflux system)